MSYSKIQKIYPSGAAVVDLGANVPYSWRPAETMIVHGWGLNLAEAPHTTTVTTSAVVTFAYDAADAGTTVSKGTITIGAAGDTIGYEKSDVSGAPFKVTGSSDALEWTTTTVISGTATTGTAVPFVYAEVFPAIAPA